MNSAAGRRTPGLTERTVHIRLHPLLVLGGPLSIWLPIGFALRSRSGERFAFPRRFSGAWL
jgi:hypothetical protein